MRHIVRVINRRPNFARTRTIILLYCIANYKTCGVHKYSRNI